MAFNLATTCEKTCASACSITCPSKIKTRLLKSSLTDFCLNDCFADCLMTFSDNQKQVFLDGKAKQQCQTLCQSFCSSIIADAVEELPDNAILFATNDVNLKKATFSKHACIQKCRLECSEKCVTSGGVGDVCQPSCDMFCSEKCNPVSKLPEVMCVSQCQPECRKECVMDSLSSLVLGFVQKTKNLTANLPSLEQLVSQYGHFQVQPVPTETRLLSKPLPSALPVESSTFSSQPQHRVPLPSEPVIKLPDITVDCHSVCLSSCFDQCQKLNRPGLKCDRLCDRTCDLNCNTNPLPSTFGSHPISEIQKKCHEQLSLKCRTLCQSKECGEICADTTGFLCRRHADCNGICQKSCSQHCLIKDKAFAQCDLQCSESCGRECRLSEDIRKECQSYCSLHCTQKCHETSPTLALRQQCLSSCPNLCHGVCYE